MVPVYAPGPGLMRLTTHSLEPTLLLKLPMLVEIKIQCDCGTKYKFEVEPLQGRMPQRVFCPGCGFEGTGAANEQLLEKLPATPTVAAKTTPIPQLPVPPKPVENLTASAMEVLPAAPLPRRSFPGAVPTARRVEGLPRMSRSRFLAGLTGAFLTGAVGALAWFFLIKVTGYQIGFAAWGVGLLVGMGTRGLGREGSQGLAAAAAVCALAAVAGGQLLAVQLRDGSLHQAILNGSLGWVTLLWLALAAASAARLASGGGAPAR